MGTRILPSQDGAITHGPHIPTLGHRRVLQPMDTGWAALPWGRCGHWVSTAHPCALPAPCTRPALFSQEVHGQQHL